MQLEDNAEDSSYNRIKNLVNEVRPLCGMPPACV